MDTLLDPVLLADIAGPSFGVRVLDAGELDALRATVTTWLDSHGVPELASLGAGIALTRATLIPFVKLQLRTRIEARTIASKTEVFNRFASYQNRSFKDDSFYIFSYLVGDGPGNLRAGEIPPPVTQKVTSSDLITDCTACSGVGTNSCGECKGQGNHSCHGCRGKLEITCTACRGAGEKKCYTCNGFGEKTCHACRSGTRHDGTRCTACHGRGYTRCNECRDGFKNCGACARQGIVTCPSCHASGRQKCGRCGGGGRIGCKPCERSGKFVTSLYVTVTQREQLAGACVLPPGGEVLVPEEVSAWLGEHVGIAPALELSSQRFDAAPCGDAGSPVAEAAQRLIDTSARDVRYRAKVHLDGLAASPVERIVQHWYTQYDIPLVKVEYRWEGQDHALWTVAPGVTLDSYDGGCARTGSAVFASEGPVAAYVGRQLAAAAALLEQGRLAQSARCADALLQALPGFRQAALLKAAGLRAQRRFAALGSLLALGGAAALGVTRLQAIMPVPLSTAAVAGLAGAALAVAALFALRRVVYRTRIIALAGQCALVGAMVLPVAASLEPAAAPSPAMAATAPAPAPVPVPPAPAAAVAKAPAVHAAAPAFDCAKASTSVERMICADPRLATLDTGLEHLYRAALANMDDRRALRDGQRAWLRQVRNRCTDPACVAQAYAGQIAELEAAIKK